MKVVFEFVGCNILCFVFVMEMLLIGRFWVDWISFGFVVFVILCVIMGKFLMIFNFIGWGIIGMCECL